MSDEHRYDDIINLPHHTSKTRPRMLQLNRAAQFAPFAALTGYGDAIAEAARLTDSKIELSEAEQEVISENLSILQANLSSRPTVTITYFKPDAKKIGGEYVSITGIIKKILNYEQMIIMEDGTVILFDAILEINID